MLSRKSEFDRKNSFWHQDETMLILAENRESAVFFADVMSIVKERSDFFVIGGAEMYRIFGDLFNKIYLTDVFTGNVLRREPNDAIFDYKIDNRQWKTIETHSIPAGPKDDFPSRFTILERKTKYVRYVEVKDYYTEAESKNRWIKEQLDLFDEFQITNPSKPLRVPYQYQLFEDKALRT